MICQDIESSRVPRSDFGFCPGMRLPWPVSSHEGMVVFSSTAYLWYDDTSR